MGMRNASVYIQVDVFVFFFFFQAEDGIRDLTVTGVQTCALPISAPALEYADAIARPSPRVAPVTRATRPDRSNKSRASASSGIDRCARSAGVDRKSTRLNSSHSQISYAVFCLKKKNQEYSVTNAP